jgi:hypothetical protein
MAEPVDPGIFSWLEADADRLKTGQERLDEPVRRNSDLMTFVEQAFAQSFRRRLGVEILSFTQNEKDEVLIATRDSDSDGAQKRLVDIYVDVCNAWPDVLSQSYGGGTADFFEFRTETVPALLSVLESLSGDAESSEWTRRLKTATRAYNEALQALRDSKTNA